MINIEAKPVRCVEIFIGETSLGLFSEAGKWNGLAELRRIKDGEKLIAGDTEGGFQEIFGDLFGGDKSQKTYVVNGSPKLIDEIRKLQDALKAEADQKD